MICGLPCNCVLFETYNHIVGYPKSWYTFLYLYFHTHITIDWNVPKEWFKVYVSPKSNTQWSFRVSLFWIFPRKKHAGVNMIISVPLHWMSEGEFFRTYQRRGWRSGWNSRKGLQLTLPGKGRGDSEQLSLESLRKDWYAPWLEQGRNWWCSYPISHEIKKLHPKNDHEETFHTWDTNTSCLPILCPWNPSNKTSTICGMSIFVEACPAASNPAGSWQWVKVQLRIPRNPCGIQAASILSIITVRVRKEQFFFGQDWKWWIWFICDICFDVWFKTSQFRYMSLIDCGSWYWLYFVHQSVL